MPRASAIGSRSPSGVRSSSEYSSCSAVMGAQPRKWAIVWGLCGDPGRDVEQADVADLAGGHEVVERAERSSIGAWRSQLCSQ
jgi:hypothetical protein